jgi:hypothetical protein
VQVFYEELWSRWPNSRVNILQHRDKYGSVWACKAVPVDGQSAIASVASDGTMRFAVLSTLVSRKQQVASTQLFRMIGIKHDVSASSSDSSHANLPAAIGRADEVTISTKTSSSLSDSKEPLAVNTDMRGFALQAIDAISLPSSQPLAANSKTSRNLALVNDSATKVLLAYGGASGLVRVHIADFVQEHCSHYR